MAIAFHASSTGSAANNAATITITKPTSSAGDVLICCFCDNRSASPGTRSGPAGWTEIGAAGGIATTKVRVQVFWSLESNTNYGFTYSGSSSDTSWTCLSFSGVDNTTPIDAAGTGNSNTGANSITPANYDAVTDGALPLVGVVDWNASHVFTSTGYTVVPSANSPCQSATLYKDAAISPAGTVTGQAINDSAGATGNHLAYQQFALRPAASAKAPPPFRRRRFFERKAG